MDKIVISIKNGGANIDASETGVTTMQIGAAIHDVLMNKLVEDVQEEGFKEKVAEFGESGEEVVTISFNEKEIIYDYQTSEALCVAVNNLCEVLCEQTEIPPFLLPIATGEMYNAFTGDKED